MDYFVNLPTWGRMWLLSVAIYGCCKLMTWRSRTVTAPAWKQAGYLLAWPGMDCDEFLRTSPATLVHPTVSEWLFALSKLGLGIGLLWGIVPLIPLTALLIRGWVGMIGLVFVLHFGLFHLLSCGWRQLGIAATPLMNWPVLSTSLADFWGRRWNLAFRDLTHRFLFIPLTPRLGPAGALFTGFFVSGLVHDLVISGPCGAGRGWPTLYFTLQGLGLLVERSRFGRWIGLRRGVTGRLVCLLWVALPSPLLFHSTFVLTVIEPFLRAIGAVR